MTPPTETATDNHLEEISSEIDKASNGTRGSSKSLMSGVSDFVSSHSKLIDLSLTSIKMVCVVVILIIISNTSITIDDLTSAAAALKLFNRDLSNIVNTSHIPRL